MRIRKLSALHMCFAIVAAESSLAPPHKKCLLGVRGGRSSSTDDPADAAIWARFIQATGGDEQCLLGIRGGRSPPTDDAAVWAQFIRATGGDEAKAQTRYDETEAWRKTNGIDALLSEPHPQFALIKQHYPHYYHGRGHRGEPVYYEIPAQINLKELKRNGVNLSDLLRHYALVTEFCWAVLERSQHGPQSQSLYVLDLEGIKLKDFVGEVVKFVKEAATFTSKHYPERSGGVYIINAPVFFNVIWKVVKPIVDPSTLEKIKVIRGKDKVLAALKERIPMHQIPPEYGGRGLPLGHSEEERYLAAMMEHNTYHHRGRMSPAEQQRSNACEFCYQALQSRGNNKSNRDGR